MKVLLHEKEPSTQVVGIDHLDQIITIATEQATKEGILSIIFLIHENDNSIGLVVGSEETVLSFTYSHQNPPYYVSKGQEENDEPIMTCFLLFQHHSEFSRKHVVSFEVGLVSAHEFYQTGELPKNIEWLEV